MANPTEPALQFNYNANATTQGVQYQAQVTTEVKQPQGNYTINAPNNPSKYQKKETSKLE